MKIVTMTVQLEEADERLRQLLAAKTLGDLKMRTGYSRSYIRDWRTGTRPAPLETARAICQAAGCEDEFDQTLAEAAGRK